MARAQTYIIDKIDNVYGHSGKLHDDNYYEFLSTYCQNLCITTFIPFYLSQNGYLVIDLDAISHNGSIYLPMEVTPFQQSWVLSRSSIFEKYLWQIKKDKCYDNCNFEKVKIMLK